MLLRVLLLMVLLRTVATANINGIVSVAKLLLLKNYIVHNDIDIVFLQEVCVANLDILHPYEYFVNLGDDTRGTAIVYRPGIILTDFIASPSGRVVSALYDNTVMINVYSPSGSGHRIDREHFFREELNIHLTRASDIILAGDFNCVLHSKDQRGPSLNKSVALQDLVTGLRLTDMWEYIHHDYVEFTFHRGTSASRIDRIYVTPSLHVAINNINVIPVSFSDHHTVCCTLQTHNTVPLLGRGYWKLNNSLLTSPEAEENFPTKWGQLVARKRFYTTILQWWSQAAKPGIQKFFRSLAYQKSIERKQTLQFYQEALYDYSRLQQQGHDVQHRISEIKHIICTKQQQILDGVKTRSRIPSLVEEERTTLYHIAKEAQQGRKRFITTLQTADGEISGTPNLLRAVTTHYSNMFEQEDAQPINAQHPFLASLQSQLDLDDATHLTVDISEDELEQAIQSCNNNKSPGPDGISFEFYKQFWPLLKHDLLLLFQELFAQTDQNLDIAQGIIVLVPKKTHPTHLSDYRPLTLINTDYKIMAKILASRIKSVLPHILGEEQHSVTSRSNIITGLSNLRSFVLHMMTEPTTAAALISLDFEKAFDRVKHSYLWSVLYKFDFPDRLIATLQKLYHGATSKIQVNGYLTKAIKIRKSIRQGCPLSTILFALSIEPFVRQLTTYLPGIQLGTAAIKVQVYADDVTVLLSRTDQIVTLKALTHAYETHSGAALSVQKSAILPFGSWPTTSAWISTVENCRILGITFTSKLDDMIHLNWTRILQTVRRTIYAQYIRNLNILQKVWVVNTFILSKLWYLAQILPPPQLILRKIDLAIGFYLWRGKQYRIARTQLYLRPKQGGLGLVCVQAKCTALLVRNITRIKFSQVTNYSQVVFASLYNTGTRRQTSNLPLPFRRTIAIMETLPPQLKLDIGPDIQTKQLYLHFLDGITRTPRIQEKYPSRRWSTVWTNLDNKWLPLQWKETGYLFINEMIPTGDKLFRHGRSASSNCHICNQPDTLRHRITSCVGAADVYQWSFTKVCSLLQLTPSYTLQDRTLHFEHNFSPVTLNNSVLWITTAAIYYIINNREHSSQLTVSKFKSYLRRERWSYAHSKRLAAAFDRHLLKL